MPHVSPTVFTAVSDRSPAKAKGCPVIATDR